MSITDHDWYICHVDTSQNSKSEYQWNEKKENVYSKEVKKKCEDSHEQREVFDWL